MDGQLRKLGKKNTHLLKIMKEKKKYFLINISIHL